MLKFSRYLLLLLFVFCTHVTQAQIIKDPTTWKYEVRKKGNNTYDLVFKVNLKKGWHLWSLTPGGDGMMLPPAFSFNKIPGVKLVGKVREKGAGKSTVEIEAVEGAVTYFEGNVEYVQTIAASPNTIIKGTHEYQVCNHECCLPPKTKNFSFVLK